MRQIGCAPWGQRGTEGRLAHPEQRRRVLTSRAERASGPFGGGGTGCRERLYDFESLTASACSCEGYVARTRDFGDAEFAAPPREDDQSFPAAPTRLRGSRCRLAIAIAALASATQRYDEVGRSGGRRVAANEAHPETSAGFRKPTTLPRLTLFSRKAGSARYDSSARWQASSMASSAQEVAGAGASLMACDSASQPWRRTVDRVADL